MTKIDPDFPLGDIFTMLHRPIQQADRKGTGLLERFLLGPQCIWEQRIYPNFQKMKELNIPSKTVQPKLLKDIVGFTKELDKITDGLTDNELRKLISIAVAIWKKKGTEASYKDIVRIFSGRPARVFNWFFFRLLVGERAFGEENLGEDNWLISTPGVELSPPLPLSTAQSNTVALYTFEGTLRDRSLTKNDMIGGHLFNFENGGAVTNSTKFLSNFNGKLKIPFNNAYNLSGDYTIEGFIKTGVANDGYIFSVKGVGTREISVEYLDSTNQLRFTLNDGSTTITALTTGSPGNLDDNTWRHWALTINQTTNQARIWLSGGNASLETDISSLSLYNVSEDLFFSTKNFATTPLKADHDNFRIALTAVYDTSDDDISVPTTGFIEFESENLDEFQTDIRIVDDGTGTLNKTVIKQLLSLMRPISERLNLIYIRFYDDFSSGKGRFDTVAGSSDSATGVMTMQASTLEVTNATGAADFTNYVASARMKVTGVTGEVGLVFGYTDDDNYYVLMLDVVNKQLKLRQNLAGSEGDLVSAVTVDIVTDVFYYLTISMFEVVETGVLNIKGYLDRNLIFEFNDVADQVVKGNFGFVTSVASIGTIDEVEMFEQPLSTELIDKTFTI